jgi:hypothetical protein
MGWFSFESIHVAYDRFAFIFGGTAEAVTSVTTWFTTLHGHSPNQARFTRSTNHSFDFTVLNVAASLLTVFPPFPRTPERQWGTECPLSVGGPTLPDCPFVLVVKERKLDHLLS